MSNLPRRSIVLMLLTLPGWRRAAASGPRTAAAGSLADAAAEPLQLAADAWTASYRFVGGERERDALDAAIEDVVSRMSFLVRGIARGRLREANEIPSRISIERAGDHLTIGFDDRRYEAPLDGSPTRVKGITGDELRYHVDVSPDRLHQVFAGDEGGRSNAMRRAGESGMSLEVKVTSGRLPGPLRYRLSFQRE